MKALALLRILLALPLAIAILNKHFVLSLILFSTAVLISILDHSVTRNEKNFVKIFGDKAVILSAVICLFFLGMAPKLIVFIIVVKDLVMVVGAILLLRKGIIAKSNFFDFIALFFQSILIAFLLMGKQDIFLIWLAAGFTVISGLSSAFRSQFITLNKSDRDITKLFKLPDGFTLMNVLCGLFSIMFTINGNINIGALLIVVAGIFDALDGRVARFIKRKGDFGKQLDSLADTISFGVAPVVLGFILIDTTVAIISYAIYLSCGVLRLARFNITESHGYFEGVPITLSALIIPILFFFKFPVVYFPYVYLVLGALMISTIGVKKI